MNRENAKKLLPIIQAFSEGQTIQHKDYSGDWINVDNPSFGFDADNYRIKPQPVECWLIVISKDSHVVHFFTSKERAEQVLCRRYSSGDYRLVHCAETVT